MPVINNRKNSSAVIHTTATATFVVAGNNSVSNVATSDEVLTGANIRTAMWSGNWTVARGANTVLALSGTGTLDFALNDMALGIDAAATVVCTLTSGTGFLMLKLGKQGGGSSQY